VSWKTKDFSTDRLYITLYILTTLELSGSVFNKRQIRSVANSLTTDGKSAIELESTVITEEDMTTENIENNHYFNYFT